MATFSTSIHESRLIDYSLPVFSNYLTIVSAYNYTEIGATSDRDLLDTYLSLDWSYFVSLISMFIFFVISWNFCSYISRRLIRRKVISRGLINRRIISEVIRKGIIRESAVWIILCALLDQDLFPINFKKMSKVSKITFSFLSICVSIFFFLLIRCFMFNMISTDLLIITQPKVIRSYEDILNRENTSAIFLGGMSEEDFFKDAKDGTAEHAIWQRRKILESISPPMIVEIVHPILEQKICAIVRHWLAVLMVYYGLSIAAVHGYSARGLITMDPSGKSFTGAFMLNTHAHPIFKKFIHDQ